MKDAGFTSTATGLREAPLTLTGDFATGARGLAQRFMSLMLATTDAPVRSVAGNLLMKNISASAGVEAVKNAVNISLTNVVAAMRSAESSSDPSSERMGTAKLTGVSFPDRDALSLEFTITSLAGESATTTANL